MRGRRDGQLTLYSCVRLEEMVPRDHLLWRLDQTIEFSFIDRLTEPLYSPTGNAVRGIGEVLGCV